MIDASSADDATSVLPMGEFLRRKQLLGNVRNVLKTFSRRKESIEDVRTASFYAGALHPDGECYMAATCRLRPLRAAALSLLREWFEEAFGNQVLLRERIWHVLDGFIRQFETHQMALSAALDRPIPLRGMVHDPEADDEEDEGVDLTETPWPECPALRKWYYELETGYRAVLMPGQSTISHLECAVESSRCLHRYGCPFLICPLPVMIQEAREELDVTRHAPLAYASDHRRCLERLREEWRRHIQVYWTWFP